jgi:hypothetical protein
MGKINSITIASYSDLIDFISNEKAPIDLSNEVAHKYLGVYGHIKERSDLVETVKKYIDEYGDFNIEDRPLFMDQTNEDFSIKEF